VVRGLERVEGSPERESAPRDAGPGGCPWRGLAVRLRRGFVPVQRCRELAVGFVRPRGREMILRRLRSHLAVARHRVVPHDAVPGGPEIRVEPRGVEQRSASERGLTELEPRDAFFHRT
jgi:hypothetical protein